jgi:hypothetical protein
MVQRTRLRLAPWVMTLRKRRCQQQMRVWRDVLQGNAVRQKSMLQCPARHPRGSPIEQSCGAGQTPVLDSFEQEVDAKAGYRSSRNEVSADARKFPVIV